ncbi:HNH endonuclease [Amycolatopsis acidicola]|uniref:HNH endonuclease n=1 Tax=Amycolatopsis acidicola TaxID=2596893 RepID=A0A5N0V2T3_9PSEU|nr:HNH endonuclease [Amycolatopsis acidicola]KAA9159439.1 HNH endonuclease [Amycolatopsis acidicola]
MLNRANQRAKVDRPTIAVCEQCEKPFEVGRFGKVPVRCTACQGERKRAYDAEYQVINRESHVAANKRYYAKVKARRQDRIIAITCLDCEQEITLVNPVGRPPKRCSSCSDVHRLARIRQNTRIRRETTDYFVNYRARNSTRLTAKAIAWAKANPEKHCARGNRYRSRKYSPVVEGFTREEIGDRDGWLCSYCGSVIDRALKFPDPWAGELDHVIPVTAPDYPGHTRANAGIIHSRCNKAKGGHKRGV